MSVNDEDEHPWLRDEKRLIGDAVRDGVPYWGACLGVQLLAASLGARVYPGDEPEVGLLPVDAHRRRVGPTPCSRASRAAFTTLQWHGDTFDLPDRAVLLAGSAAYPHQAFRYERAYGVQFHLEVSLDMAEAWAEGPGVRRVPGPGPRARVAAPLIDELRRRGPEMLDHGRALFGNWLDTMVGTRT